MANSKSSVVVATLVPSANAKGAHYVFAVNGRKGQIYVPRSYFDAAPETLEFVSLEFGANSERKAPLTADERKALAIARANRTPRELADEAKRIADEANAKYRAALANVAPAKKVLRGARKAKPAVVAPDSTETTETDSTETTETDSTDNATA